SSSVFVGAVSASTLCASAFPFVSRPTPIARPRSLEYLEHNVIACSKCDRRSLRTVSFCAAHVVYAVVDSEANSPSRLPTTTGIRTTRSPLGGGPSFLIIAFDLQDKI